MKVSLWPSDLVGNRHGENGLYPWKKELQNLENCCISYFLKVGVLTKNHEYCFIPCLTFRDSTAKVATPVKRFTWSPFWQPFSVVQVILSITRAFRNKTWFINKFNYQDYHTNCKFLHEHPSIKTNPAQHQVLFSQLPNTHEHWKQRLFQQT